MNQGIGGLCLAIFHSKSSLFKASLCSFPPIILSPLHLHHFAFNLLSSSFLPSELDKGSSQLLTETGTRPLGWIPTAHRTQEELDFCMGNVWVGLRTGTDWGQIRPKFCFKLEAYTNSCPYYVICFPVHANYLNCLFHFHLIQYYEPL